jgi:carboxypeptidase Q
LKNNITSNKLIIILFMSIIFSGYLFSQTIPDSIKFFQYKNISKQFVSSALGERKGYVMLKSLCRIGPRLCGSHNSLIAINWAYNKMHEMGLDTVWKQPVMVPHWERGNIEEAVLNDSNHIYVRKLNISALGGSIGTPDKGITAKVIEVKSFEELEKRGSDVKGKIVFFNRPLDQTILNTFTGYDNAVDQRFYGAVESAKYGAVGVLVRSITTEFDNVPHIGSMTYNDTLPELPAAAIGYTDADFLSAALNEEPNLTVTLLLKCRTLPDAQSYNVIGEIKGTEHPDEIIVIGGHTDSWDVGEGAHDDGAGCTQALEVLDLFKRLKIEPKRTIRVVLFINEENGGRGGRAYASYVDSLKQFHLAAIESDRGAFTPRGFTINTDSLALIEKLDSWLPFLQTAGIEWIRNGGSGPDISKLKNVKLLFGYVPDCQRYFDFHHSAKDVFSVINPREFELGSASIAILTYLLSEEGI